MNKDGSRAVRKKEGSSYHHGNLRSALIQAGLRILREKGTHSLTLRESSREAGVSQAAPYRHFKNKEALLAAISLEGFALLGERIRAADCPAGAGNAGAAEEGLFQIGLAYVQHASENPHHFRLMFNPVPPISFSEHPELQRAARELFSQISAFVQRYQTDGRFKGGDPEPVAVLIWSTFHGLASMLIDRDLCGAGVKLPKVETLVHSLSRNLLEGIA